MTVGKIESDNFRNYIEDARKNLLDLTYRNKLINFRPAKVRTVSVIETDIVEIFTALVVKGKEVRLAAKYLDGEEGEECGEDVAEYKEELIPWDNSSKLKTSYNASLLTPFDNENLTKRLKKLFSQANSAIEEQGYNILYLALGFLHWKDSKADRGSHSPMVLIPVLLKRSEDRRYYTLAWTGDDIQTNTSLQKKLIELGVNLPDFEMGDDDEDLSKYLDCVSEAISNMPGWMVTGEAYIDIFNFTKFTMYNDLNPDLWPNGINLSSFPVLDLLFNQVNKSSGVDFKEDEVDERLPAEKLYHVMDADSSQIAVIEDVKAGRTMVVEGPPGTGKSQTITNAIAELLAQGKTVLFISEKMAALEVVKNRLDQVGLGDYCMELHSHKMNKKLFLDELRRTLLLPEKTNHIMCSALKDLDTLRNQLNAYPKELFGPIGRMNYSPFQLFGFIEDCRRHFENVNRVMRNVELRPPAHYTEQDWSRAIIFIHDLENSLDRVLPIRMNPWYGTSPKVYEPRQQRDLKNAVDNAKKIIDTNISNLKSLTETLGFSMPSTMVELEHLVNVTTLIKSLDGAGISSVFDDEWNQKESVAINTIARVSELEKMDEEILTDYKTEVLKLDAKSLYEEFVVLTQKLLPFRILNRRYRDNRGLMASYKKSGKNISDIKILADLRLLSERQTLAGSISQNIDAQSVFGRYWDINEWSAESLTEVLDNMRRLRTEVEAGVVLQRWFELSTGNVGSKDTFNALNDFVSIKKGISDILDDIIRKVSLDVGIILPDGIGSAKFSHISDIVGGWGDNIDAVLDWSQYRKLISDNTDNRAYPLVQAMEEDPFPLDDLLPTFWGNFAEQLLAKAFDERPSLRSFDGQSHLKTIDRFVKLDKRVIEENRRRLAYQMWSRIPSVSVEVSSSSEMGILRNEFVKKRRLKSIRRLMNEAGGLILRIKPCFMMSPLSLAQYVDQRAIKFDVIIFDEASQVKPQDALGCLMRGNQAVVIGDSKQLPPTTFFDILEKEDECVDDQMVLPSDIESVLDFFKPRVLSKNLRWHYRSRHESLIALSNREFYDNRLFVYPSPMDRSEWFGLRFIHTKESVYDRGKSQTNRIEARRVVEDAFNHYRIHPERSLGIATFNKNQQQAIEDEIERKLDEDPSLQRFFQKGNYEYCFIKNLETIQGDERDIILVSVGYGFDAHGKLSQNFGPVNREGGERRLNVLMTRSREKCVIYCNFRSADLDVATTTVRGVKVLKEFLEYAETGHMPLTMQIEEDLDSPFEQAVHDFLVGEGYQLRKQVGCAGFRIDLAIIDPDNPGNYLLGIECDGAQYHSSKVARDRDRLRQQVLENLGWRICRVWSTDWYRRPADAQEKLLFDVISAVEEGPLKIVQRSSPMLPPSRTTEKTEIPKKMVNTKGDITSGLPRYVKARAERYSFVDGESFIDIPSQWLVESISKIVQVESPVHVEEVYDRIREWTGVKRKGKRIDEHFYYALNQSTTFLDKCLTRKDNFLWKGKPSPIKARVRNGEDPRELQRISKEEIREAINHVLNTQYGSTQDGLISSVVKIFGIKATEQNRIFIEGEIQRMIKQSILDIRPNGHIYFK